MTPMRGPDGRYIQPGEVIQEWLSGILRDAPGAVPKVLGATAAHCVNEMHRHLRAAHKLMEAGALAAIDAELDACMEWRRVRDAVRRCAFEVKGAK